MAATWITAVNASTGQCAEKMEWRAGKRREKREKSVVDMFLGSVPRRAMGAASSRHHSVIRMS
jgi:hypothetical protein